MISLFRNKKSNIMDVMVIGVILVIIAIGIMVINYAFDAVEPDITSDFQERNKTEAETILTDTHTSFPSIFDGAIVFLLIGLWLTSLISAFFLDSHPIFFVVSIVILIPILIAMVILNNFYIETMELADFVTYKTQYPMTYWIGSNIFITLIIIGGSVLAALYAKMSQ